MSGLSLSEGQVVAGRYRLDCPLGEGGMGHVWRAMHLTLKSPVAIKFIDPAVARDSASISRFMLEARAAAALRSTHIVQVLDLGVQDNAPYIVMELLSGETLADRLHRQGVLSATETGHIMEQVGRAIAQAHAAGIVHRDLKPDNIFLVREGDDEVAKVFDFGVAKAARETFEVTKRDGTRAGALLGTPHYVSPEQASGEQTVDYRTDLWAMAIIFYECLTGQRPFEGQGLGKLLTKICHEEPVAPSQVALVPPGFDEWFARASQKDPERRFQSAKEMIDAYWMLITHRDEVTGKTESSGTAARRESHDPTTPAFAVSGPESTLPAVPGALRTPAKGWRSTRGKVALIGAAAGALLAAGSLLIERGASPERDGSALSLEANAPAGPTVASAASLPSAQPEPGLAAAAPAPARPSSSQSQPPAPVAAGRAARALARRPRASVSRTQGAPDGGAPKQVSPAATSSSLLRSGAGLFDERK